MNPKVLLLVVFLCLVATVPAQKGRKKGIEVWIRPKPVPDLAPPP
ncbi:hypothetical protein M5D96_005557 [Drosophila gunungcola]|uniref:Uncharacterized protein n=1 Tax=Drosophila gunungcola TaxID=103775 RepID=A0A9Q0BRA4_9MUSC|nr:hypothetical protein M5D96_005557 [Drosophila gunungcola]